MKAEGQQTVQSVERALRIMECFTLDKPSLSLGELAKKTGLSKSTVYRLLTTLASLNYIKQDPNSQKYSLGFKLFNLGAVVAGNMRIRSVALPYLEELGQETSESISLNIVDGADRICIELVESNEEVRNFTRIGHRNPLWIGGSGKVLLAYLNEGKKEQIIHDALKNGAITEIKQLEKDLDTIVKQGYIVTMNERVSGAFGLIAPIFDHSSIAASLTLSAPIMRYSEERMQFLIPKVRDTAKKISRELGWNIG
jgi:IclR family KDG regulon transcriptional repressor